MSTLTSTTLFQRPDKRQETLTFIESCLGYSKKHHFAVDFYPLLKKDNHVNCHILLNEKSEVIAHAAFKKRSFKLEKDFPVLITGGLCIRKDYRGKKIFKKFFTQIKESYKEQTTFFILWSDQIDLYEKLGFTLCGEQLYLQQGTLKQDHPQQFQTKEISLSSTTIEMLKKLHNSGPNLTLLRGHSDWEDIRQTKSLKFFQISKEETILGYFFKDKGQDLQNVIHEFYFKDLSYASQILKELNQGHALIIPPHFFPDLNTSYLFFLAPGNKSLVSQFFYEYTNQKISIQSIHEKNWNIKLDGKEYSLEQKDFLTGIFGPNRFTEIHEVFKKPFISGVDSH